MGESAGEKSQNKTKMQQQQYAKKGQKLKKSVKKAGFHNICATIRTHRESWCLPYAAFFIECLTTFRPNQIEMF